MREQRGNEATAQQQQQHIRRPESACNWGRLVMSAMVMAAHVWATWLLVLVLVWRGERLLAYLKAQQLAFVREPTDTVVGELCDCAIVIVLEMSSG